MMMAGWPKYNFTSFSTVYVILGLWKVDNESNGTPFTVDDFASSSHPTRSARPVGQRLTH